MKNNGMTILLIWIVMQVVSPFPARGAEESEFDQIVVLQEDEYLNTELSLEKCELSNRAYSFGDEVWLINGRTSHYTNSMISHTDIFRLEENGFETRELSLLLDSHQQDPAKVTVLYVHGDRTDEFYACYRGIEVYQSIFLSSECPRPPVRFIIWSWKSEKEILRPSKDYRVKANRSRCVGRSLATFLNHFPDQRILLAGYSLGTQVLFDALSEPQILGRNNEASGSGYQLALIAPALDGNYVSTKRHCPGEMLPVDHAEIFDNSRDRVLKFVRYHGRRTTVGGGYPIRCLAYEGKLGLLSLGFHDLSPFVGNKHAIYYYTDVPIVKQRMREMVTDLATIKVQSNGGSSLP